MGKPYIGITGFTEFGQQALPLSRMGDSSRLLMVGVLASLKTLRRESGRNEKRFPSLDRMGMIFYDDPRAVNLVHYNTSEPNSLAGQIAVLRAWIGECCHGIQLNVCWPDLKELREIRKQWPKARIVLQCGARALGQLQYDPVDICHRLTFYAQEGVIDDVLIDPSGGRGQLLDLTRVEPLVYKLYEDHLPIGVGIAGGLTATTVNNLDPLVKQYPDLSIDAEGGLRTPDDQLDEDQVDWYVQAAQKMFT